MKKLVFIFVLTLSIHAQNNEADSLLFKQSVGVGLTYGAIGGQFSVSSSSFKAFLGVSIISIGVGFQQTITKNLNHTAGVFYSTAGLGLVGRTYLLYTYDYYVNSFLNSGMSYSICLIQLTDTVDYSLYPHFQIGYHFE